MKNQDWNILESIEAVRNAAEKNQLSVVKTKDVEKALTNLNEYFNTTETQTIILCAAIGYYFEENGDPCEYKNLARFFDVSIMQLLLHNKDFLELKNKALIVKPEEKSRLSRIRRIRGSNDMSFSINENVIHSILANQELTVSYEEKEIDNVEFVNNIANKVDDRDRCNQETYELFEEIQQMEEKSSKLKFIKDSKLLLPELSHRVFFYVVCKDFLTGRDSDLDRTINDIYSNAAGLREAKLMMEGVHPLISHNILEFERKGTLSQATLTLGSKGRKLFLDENTSLFETSVNDENYIKPEDIVEKNLIFDDEAAAKLEELKSYLKEENLVAIQKRLAAKKMNTGFTTLFYGTSGTGKTETAYQIAKATGRGIYHVDISTTKSAWFGDSEKAVRKIFTKYKTICQQTKKAGLPLPILLFNEADAIFQKRTNFESSNMSKTENAMQNILLEELEKIEGILIATTNLPENMDQAFMRRFLFKVEFEIPSSETASTIWKSKLGWLSDSDSQELARAFTLSGGLIENVARKATMFETLHNDFPTLNQINNYCMEESNTKFGCFLK